MKKELCDQLISECEQTAQKMGADLYEIMREASGIVERWRPYYLLAQKAWENAGSREGATAFLLTAPDPNPEEFERLLAVMRTLPYFLRGALQDAGKSLPPSPGGRPRELTPEERRDVCTQIGYLYGQGVALSDAKKRMALRYDVSLRTIQRAWQEREMRKGKPSQCAMGVGHE